MINHVNNLIFSFVFLIKNFMHILFCVLLDTALVARLEQCVGCGGS